MVSLKKIFRSLVIGSRELKTLPGYKPKPAKQAGLSKSRLEEDIEDYIKTAKSEKEIKIIKKKKGKEIKKQKIKKPEIDKKALKKQLLEIEKKYNELMKKGYSKEKLKAISNRIKSMKKILS